MSCRTSLILALLTGLIAPLASASTLERELGELSLRLGSTPGRSMAQGLVAPAGSGRLHGGLDLTHTTGWYAGQWFPSLGLTPGHTLETDTYLGYRQAFSRRQGPGYELGLIRYSQPQQKDSTRHELYGGLTLPASRLGAAWSQSHGRQDSTLLLDLDLPGSPELGMTLKYASHVLDSPVQVSENHSIRRYEDWSLSLSRAWHTTELGLSYSGASLSGDNCTVYSGQNPGCRHTLTLQISQPLF